MIPPRDISGSSLNRTNLPLAPDTPTTAPDADRGLVIAMQHSRRDVVDLANVVGVLRRCGFSQLADEASRDLPDPVDVDRLVAWGMRHGVSMNDMVSQMGGSP